jgi:hypothetical protein
LAALRQAAAPRRRLAAEARLARIARQGGAVLLLWQRLGGKIPLFSVLRPGQDWFVGGKLDSNK